MKNKPIILVAGEPNSIFLEIFFKAIKFKKYNSPLILICCKKILLDQMKKNKFKKKINILELHKLKKYSLDNNSINLIDVECKKLNKNFNLNLTNKYLIASFELALKLIKDKHSSKLINGPINKKSFLNKKFLGMTEYISDQYNVKKTGMLIYNKKLSVVPLTTHLRIKDIPRHITSKLIIQKIRSLDKEFKKIFKIKPKIGILGLNPHNAELKKDSEEVKKIKPAILKLKNIGLNVTGPLVADTVFINNYKKYNVIVGMYHDQVLAPFKTLFHFNAINITLGLNYLRVSPDHGPAFDLIRKNKANYSSLFECIKFINSIN